ncbi:MAG: Holliday junction resolvase RuvX [Planctomycetota bacterium]|nr:Holliday junction resolvase RuvX [Planctomycetota bacterium]
MIILGVDLGERRVGFAVSDEKELLAVTSGSARVRSLDAALLAVAGKAGTERAGLVVVGHPVNMNGRPGPKAREAALFAERLRDAGWAVELWDERLTTSAAERKLQAAGLDRRRRKALIDENAAREILASFLERRARDGGGRSV